MARYNEILVGRFNRGLQKLFGIRSGEAVAPQLASDVQPSISLFSGAEDRIFQGWNRYAIWNTCAAVVAQGSVVQFRNPIGSNVIAVFERILLQQPGGAASDIGLRFGHNSSTDQNLLLGGVGPLDLRSGLSSFSVLVGSNNTGAPSAAGVTIFRVAAAVPTPYDVITDPDQQMFLEPGDVFQAFLTTVNLALHTNWIWRERFIEEGERF